MYKIYSQNEVYTQECTDLAYNVFTNMLPYYVNISFLVVKVKLSNRKNRHQKMWTPKLEHLKSKVSIYNELVKQIIITCSKKYAEKLIRNIEKNEIRWIRIIMTCKFRPQVTNQKQHPI